MSPPSALSAPTKPNCRRMGVAALLLVCLSAYCGLLRRPLASNQAEGVSGRMYTYQTLGLSSSSARGGVLGGSGKEHRLPPALLCEDARAMLQYHRPAHVPSDCWLNASEAVRAAEAALKEGDVRRIRHVDCLYVHDPAFFERYLPEALFESWRQNTHHWRVKNQSLTSVLPEVRKWYITYGDQCCEKAIPRALEHARRAGFDEVIGYDRQAISPGFNATYAHILSLRRGAGYWLWKPYVVLKTLVERMDWGDYLCYVDAGSHAIKDAGDLVAFAAIQPYGVWLPNTDDRWLEGRLQKRDNLILMGMDYESVRRSVQAQANHMCLPKSAYTIQLVSEWLMYATDERCITDMDNTLGQPNYPEFHDHRHDQAVFSLTTKRWGLPQWRDATQSGEGDMSREGFLREASGPYMQTFSHTRDKSR